MAVCSMQILERERFRAAAWRQAEEEGGGDIRAFARYYKALGL